MKLSAKHERFSKLLIALLLTSLLLPALAACSDGGETSTQNETTASETTAAATTEAAFEDLPLEDQLALTVAELPQHDYEGYTFTVLDRSEETGLWYTQDVYTEALNGEPINDAVYERNRTLEEAYNIKVAEKAVKSPQSDIKTAVLAGDDIYDTATAGINSLANMISEGILLEMTQFDELHLDSPWWDKNLKDGMSIADKLYFSTGDISIMDNLGTWAITFNKDLVGSLGLDDPYELVNSGKWTIDKMHSMALEAAADLDGDGVMGDLDRYGSCTENFNVYAYWVGGGQTIIGKDDDDLPVLTLWSDRSASVMDAVMAFQNDKSIITATATRADGRYMYEVFRDGLALFTYGGMMTFMHYRDSEVDYGILTAPKFDEAQDSYHNTYSHANCTAYMMPASAKDPSRTAAILDAMARISKYTLSPSYYDITLSNKYLRDEESVHMIDIILSTRSFDLGSAFNWGKCHNLVTGMFDAPEGSFASKYTASEEAIETAIAQFIEDIS